MESDHKPGNPYANTFADPYAEMAAQGIVKVNDNIRTPPGALGPIAGGSWPVITPASPRHGIVTVGVGSVPWIQDEGERRAMLARRLHISEDASHFAFQYISTALVGEKVFVFVVQNGVPVTLEDPTALFPSDTLIAQLGLLKT